jgi:hypothetical protein
MVVLRELGVKPAHELKELIRSFQLVVGEMELDIIDKKRFGTVQILLVNHREHIPEPIGHFVALYQSIVIHNLSPFLLYFKVNNYLLSSVFMAKTKQGTL